MSMRSARGRAKEVSHRRTDVFGVVLIATSLILVLSLALPDTGVLGGTVATVLTGLFGRGAWLCPILPAVAGFGLLFGRLALRVDHVSFGLLLVYLSVLGFLAKGSPEGDYLDPIAATQTGGYVGAIVATSFRFLLGSAMGVGLGAVATVGLVLAVNTPIRAIVTAVGSWVQSARSKRSRREKPQKPKERVSEAVVVSKPKERPQAEEETPKRKPKPAPLPKTPVEPPTPAKQPATTQKAVVEMEATPKEGFDLPPLSLLHPPQVKAKRNQAELQRNREILEATLEEFGIEANVVEFAHGPTLTRYEVQLGPGVRVSRIKSLADNIAMSLAAHHVRVEAPIPGKAAIGIEVPNTTRSVVSLREVAQDEEFLQHPSKLAVCLGQDVAGQNVFADLAKMPHLLIGGATNSGKSIGLATIITSLLLRNTPTDLRLVLLDPKRVELTLFDGIPHLFCPVVKDVKLMAATLRQIWKEMDDRYDLLSEAGVRNIEAYNQKVSFAERLPYIVVVIDELADLMIQAANDVEDSICRLAQLARATGIHLVIATQRPSVDVITGTIKANISSRIAFAVSSLVDSRTILDCGGAENLIGQGDMLFFPIGAAKPMRVQGCFVSEAEIHAICEHWRQQAKPEYCLDPVEALIERAEANRVADEEEDPLYLEAVLFVAERGEASTSMLQRRFKIGFQRASRLLDMMEERGIVGPRDGPRPREVLLSPEEARGMINS
ncbi:MAG: DNA translocase FtsK [Fimbriimonadales bacterium]|nr:MAG: DNA translocase FtsK [Fimbriimonadales bacterium]